MFYRLINNAFVFVALMIIYRLLLDYAYINTIAPYFGYAQLTYEPEIYSQTISMVSFVIGTAFVLPYRKMQGVFTPQIMMFFYLLAFVPMTSFWACKRQEMDFMITCLIFWFLFFIAMRFIKGIDLTRYIEYNPKWIDIIVVIMSLVILFISGYYTHFRIHLSLADVYDLRHEARDYNIPKILNYIWIASKNVLPLALIYYLDNKRKLMVCIVIFICLLNFSIAGLKTTLFNMFICIALYYCGKKEMSKLLPYAFILLVTIVIVEYLNTDFSYISVLLLRRGFYIPNLLDQFYFDYIVNSSPLYFQTPKVDISFIIGDYYFNNEEMRANNGLFSDAMVNLGYLGVIIFPLLYAYLFKTCERSFKYANRNQSLFTAFLVMHTLRSSFLTTSLLTHGVFLLLLSMMFMSKPTQYNQICLQNK